MYKEIQNSLLGLYYNRRASIPFLWRVSDQRFDGVVYIPVLFSQILDILTFVNFQLRNSTSNLEIETIYPYFLCKINIFTVYDMFLNLRSKIIMKSELFRKIHPLNRKFKFPLIWCFCEREWNHKKIFTQNMKECVIDSRTVEYFITGVYKILFDMID